MLRATCTLRDFDKQGAGAGGAGYGEGGGAPGEAHPGADRIARAALTQDTAYGAGGGSGRSDKAERAPVGGSSTKHDGGRPADDTTRGSTAPRLQGQKRTRKAEEGKGLHTGPRKRLQQQDIRRFGGGGMADNPESGHQRCEARHSAAGTSARPIMMHTKGDAALTRQRGVSTPRGCKRQRPDDKTFEHEEGEGKGTEPRKKVPGRRETEQELRAAVAGAQLGGKEPGGLGERERRALRGKTLLVRKFRLGV